MKRTIVISYVLGIKVCLRSNTTGGTLFTFRNVYTCKCKLGHEDNFFVFLFFLGGIPPSLLGLDMLEAPLT
jgi:hypothetical protein